MQLEIQPSENSVKSIEQVFKNNLKQLDMQLAVMELIRKELIKCMGNVKNLL